MKFSLLLSSLLLVGCLGINSGNPMKRDTASVSPLTTKATASAVCTRCVCLTTGDLEELRWMLEEVPPFPYSWDEVY